MVASGKAPAQEPTRTTSDERDIVLILDVSGSMSGTPMTETKKAATNFVNTILEEDASIGVINYEDREFFSVLFFAYKEIHHIYFGICDLHDRSRELISSYLLFV